MTLATRVIPEISKFKSSDKKNQPSNISFLLLQFFLNTEKKHLYGAFKCDF